MRVDWVPYSAAALVLGATALSVGALLLPSGRRGRSDHAADGRRARVAAGWPSPCSTSSPSVTLTIGMPSILTLFQGRGARIGLTAVGVFTVGCVGIAGFAMLLVFFRALAVTDAIDAGTIDAGRARRPGSPSFLLRLDRRVLPRRAAARDRAVPRARRRRAWIPGRCCSARGAVPGLVVLPAPAGPVDDRRCCITVGLCGVGITANQNAAQARARLDGARATGRLTRPARDLGALVGVQHHLADPHRLRA